MYLNRITLIGFIGGDAEKKASNATNIAIFSLATKTSWKNDSGVWESRTEWHRYVAFGKLADFVGTITRDATSCHAWPFHHWVSLATMWTHSGLCAGIRGK
jgi:single-strand DNA-binding protein